MPDTAPQWLTDLVSEFGERAKSLLAGPGEREATIRPPLDHMVTKIGERAGRTVVMHSEVRDTERHVRPDYGVQVDGVITGYLEVKAPKVAIDPDSFRGRNLKQWERLRDLPNLIYTNGTEWRLYRGSEPVGDPVVLNGGPLENAGTALTAGPEFEALLRQFFDWEPAPIRTVPKLVATVAPLTRLLRGDVIERLREERAAVEGGARIEDQQFSGLAHDWRRLLFPEATDAKFADGYAQTVTFALLLATSDGVDLSATNLHGVGDAMRARHSLMGRALQLLTDEMADDFRISLELLTRVIGAINWDRIRASPRDTYLYLYEQFLEEYDPELRQQSGSYYTPLPIVEQMVRLTEEVLTGHLGRAIGFSDPNVTVVDPAMGTGTYLHAIIEQASDQIRAQDGPGAVAGRVTDLATRLIGFELQTGPYAVAELRTSDMLRRIGANPPPRGMRTYVTNTLDDPYLESDQLGSHFRAISDSRRLANQVKANTPVTVVIGNPPYREKAEGEGGWVEAGDAAHGDRRRPILDDFKADGNGKFEYVLKNLYVYFWRWATWKVFDSAPEDSEGVVCFISTNGYQRGPGFRGMREYLRRTCTAGWVIDLSPEGHRPDVPTRVFPGVQQTLSIGIFVRGNEVSHDHPADISYVALSGRRDDKYRALEGLTLDSPMWRHARTGWQDPFTPAADSSWDDYPALSDVMPWTAPGVKPNRTWVYSPLAKTLHDRWKALVSESDPDEKKRLFKESDSAKVDMAKPPLPGFPDQPKVSFGAQPGKFPEPVRVGYRAFDRQWIIPDSRLIHRPSPPLWQAFRDGQVYVVEQHSKVISSGPGIVFSGLIPDMDHFKGSEGGRTLPFLHPNGDPNIAPGLTKALSTILDVPVTAEDVLAYVAAIVSSPAFTETFADELTTPGIRVPFTGDPDIWGAAVHLGREVVWAQTYGSALSEPSEGRPKGNVRLSTGSKLQQPLCIEGMTAMPTVMSYDADKGRLNVGDGAWSPVDPRVVDYSVGGKNVLTSWFGYRRKTPGGRKSSPLDHLHPELWPSEWTTELTDLLAVLTRLVSLEDAQAELLGRVLVGRIVERPELEANGVRWPRAAADRNPRSGPPETGAVGEQLML